ncbi:hypothetical protein ABBQ32_001441 [Trebouxia sp. C0010 RCD-2024]
MQTTTPATASPPQIQNAAEAIQALTEDAAGLAAKLGHLTAARQRCASKDVTSTLQHLALYREAVQTLQANTTAVIQQSAEMQQECQELYDDFGATDALAQDVHQLRKNVEKLEACLATKMKGS